MYQTLLTSLENNILTITISRTDKLNALNKTMMAELEEALINIEKDDSIKAVIITGSGQKAFVAGADISEFTGLTNEEGMDLARRGQNVFFKIENATKPIIAAVNGFALGGGCELAMACHFRIASENAQFGQPEVNLGLIPGYGGTQRLPQLIGKGRALELLMTGNLINAETALHYGLVNHVVKQEELLDKARTIIQTIFTKAPLAISRCIATVNAGITQHHGYDKEIEAFGECFATEDMTEGATAFLERRKPVFKGK
jgi:enoyl-CoA hydratase